VNHPALNRSLWSRLGVELPLRIAMIGPVVMIAG